MIAVRKRLLQRETGNSQAAAPWLGLPVAETGCPLHRGSVFPRRATAVHLYERFAARIVTQSIPRFALENRSGGTFAKRLLGEDLIVEFAD